MLHKKNIKRNHIICVQIFPISKNIINKTLKMIRELDKDFDLKKINYDDQKVYELLSNGHTVGLFQLESSGMKEA